MTRAALILPYKAIQVRSLLLTSSHSLLPSSSSLAEMNLYAFVQSVAVMVCSLSPTPALPTSHGLAFNYQLARNMAVSLSALVMIHMAVQVVGTSYFSTPEPFTTSHVAHQSTVSCVDAAASRGHGWIREAC